MQKKSVDCLAEGVVLDKHKNLHYYVSNGLVYDLRHKFSSNNGLVNGAYVNGNMVYLPMSHGNYHPVGEVYSKNKLH